MCWWPSSPLQRRWSSLCYASGSETEKIRKKVGRASPTETNRRRKPMKKRILSILLTLCMVLCLMPTAVFAEGNEDTPTQALTSVDITFPKPEEGKKIGDGSAASASGLTFLEFGPALWQQDGEPKKLKADDTYEKDNIYLLYFAFYTQKPITDETALTFNGNPITRYEDYQALAEALNAYDGKEDAYLGFVMFSEKGTGDPSMKDLKDLYIIGLYAIIRAQEAQTPEDTVKEQFNLTSGGTYYFDLSAENILGTVNDALPDNTMHYVPFTYAGTVDAYKLTSERETTEEYAQQNKYPHSLFVADYAVKHTVSWNDLHTEGLIFGKDYAAGGVNYTLRAPSAGSDRTGLNESQRGTPQSNEWDKLLDKNDGYIKNWNWMASWGQDTRPDNSTPFRAVRGFHSARGWEFNSSSYQNGILGFRPVLEVLNPDALDADGLKAVTLALGGGKLGGSAEDIQIIVKNGESFTAPASDGLTRPDRNTENYFKWLGSDGNLYAPGESVSADVTKLTAKFAGGSSGSGGGGGSRKPSVTYYTLHFETNGGSAITDMREENNTRISLTKYVPTRHGYTFIGWYSDQSLTNQISEVSLTKNMTVYAGWRADENLDIVVNPFTDVSEKDWFYNDAMFVYKNGLMLGTSKTLFSPHGTVTRGMMATILWRMEGSLAPKDENSFTDVEAGMWYADAITWTTANGIFAGYSKDKFGPDDPITREQLTAIFYRYADYKGYKLTVTENLDKFEDADKITDYAKMVMQWAVGNGLIKGKSENLLDPQGTATRAEIAAMLHRFVEKAKPMQMD